MKEYKQQTSLYTISFTFQSFITISHMVTILIKERRAHARELEAEDESYEEG
jgi:hypothetical protein